MNQQKQKQTQIPDEVIEEIRKDVKETTHGQVIITIQDSKVLGYDVTKKRRL